MWAIKGVCSISRTRTTENLKLTAILGICRVEETFDFERGSKSILGRLCNKVLFSMRALGVRSVCSVTGLLTSQ
jgi:hypothetical protein